MTKKVIVIISIAAAFALAMFSLATTYLTLEMDSHRIYASIHNNDSTISLGDPFFVEKGKVIGQRVLSVMPQPQLEFTFVANGTLNDTVNFTNTGTTVSDLQADGTFTSKGQGFIMTVDGEVATWTNQVVGQLTQEGKVLSSGVGFWNTPSTGSLAFMDNLMTIFKLEIDREGNLSAEEWEWK
jgi:hypothetical protein